MKTLHEYASIHKGTPCFIAGASPSLRHIDCNTLKNCLVFAVNSAVLKFPSANYFVSDDAAITSWNYWKVAYANTSCTKFLYRKKFVALDLPERDDIVFYDHREYATHDSQGLVYHLDNLVVYSDASIPVIGARSSVASAVNIAHIMGCDPIVLIGHDCCYEGNKRYFWQFDGENKAVEARNRVYSTPDRGTINGSPVDGHCVDYKLYWQHFMQVNNDKINIIDASSNSILNTFKKSTIADVLYKYGDNHV